MFNQSLRLSVPSVCSCNFVQARCSLQFMFITWTLQKKKNNKKKKPIKIHMGIYFKLTSFKNVHSEINNF